jgi:hypothetical protein
MGIVRRNGARPVIHRSQQRRRWTNISQRAAGRASVEAQRYIPALSTERSPVFVHKPLILLVF